MHAIISQRNAITLTFLMTLSAYSQTPYAASLLVNDAYIAAHGNIITGSYQGTTTQPAITIATKQPVIIQDALVTGPGDLIYGSGNINLVVENTTGYGTNPNVLNMQKGKFINITYATNLVVDHCTIEGTRFGVYVNSFVGNRNPQPGDPVQTIKITNNKVINIDGRQSNGLGGYIQSGNFNAHAFQFNQVQAVPELEIAWNQVINEPYNSQTSDHINIYSSSGTPTSHLLIHDNYLQGAYAGNPGVDRYTGGGIITDGKLADTFTTATAYVDIYNNQVVSTSNYGFSIAAGHDNVIYNNRVVSSGVMANSQQIGMTFANGVNNYNNYKQPTTVYFNNYAHDNFSGVIRTSSTGVLQRSDWYLPGQASNSGNNAHFMPNTIAAPTLADEENEFQLWQTKLDNANVAVGAYTVEALK